MNNTEDTKAKDEVMAAQDMPGHMTFKQTLPQPPLKGVPKTVGDNDRDMSLEGDEGVSSAHLHSSRVLEGYQQPNMGLGGQGICGGSPVIPGDSGLMVELAQKPLNNKVDVIDEHMAGISVSSQGGVVNPHPPPHVASGVNVSWSLGMLGNFGNEELLKHGGVNVNGSGMKVSNGYSNFDVAGAAPFNDTACGRGACGVGGQGSILFVGDLHWWTTDADLESELCKYGPVKEVRFFDDKASGKSKGYCLVEFYDPATASTCKEGMNGHVFNGRQCVVAYSSPYTVKIMGEAEVSRNQSTTLQPTAPLGKRHIADAPVRPATNNIASGNNYQGSGDNNRGYGRGN